LLARGTKDFLVTRCNQHLAYLYKFSPGSDYQLLFKSFPSFGSWDTLCFLHPLTAVSGTLHVIWFLFYELFFPQDAFNPRGPEAQRPPVFTSIESPWWFPDLFPALAVLKARVLWAA
jgi:hypothetical protein